MPVAPSMTAYYPSRSYYSSRSTPSSSLLSRTTSLDRSSYSSYSPVSSYGISSYTPYSGSTYTSRYSSSSASKPPRPSYSSTYSTESYRPRNARDTSPVRSSYTRNSSESRDSETRSTDSRQDSISRTLGARSISDTSSRYAASTVSSRLRDTSNSRDSGYSSRFTSRDRSLDIKNGNTFDTKSYGPSVSSYASNYHWEGRNKNKEKKSEIPDCESAEALEKIRVSDRIRNFEPFEDDGVPTPAPLTVSEEVLARRKKEEDKLAARRQRLGLSPIRKSRSKTPDYQNHKSSSYRSDYCQNLSPERNGNDDTEAEIERRQSVSELRRKYDSSDQNGYASSSKDESDISKDQTRTSSYSTEARETPSIRCESPTYNSSSTRHRTDSENFSRESPPSSKYSNDCGKNDAESDKDLRGSNKLGSPMTTHRKLESPKSRSPDGRKSPLSNGISTKVSNYGIKCMFSHGKSNLTCNSLLVCTKV